MQFQEINPNQKQDWSLKLKDRKLTIYTYYIVEIMAWDQHFYSLHTCSGMGCIQIKKANTDTKIIKPKYIFLRKLASRIYSIYHA